MVGLQVQTQSAQHASADGSCTLPAPASPDPGTVDAPGGVSSQRHEIREVHISLALMEDFMQCAPLQHLHN